jgi:hypothetical protein
MNFQETQHLLNFLIMSLVSTSGIIIIVDFICGLFQLWHQVSVELNKSNSCDNQLFSNSAIIEDITLTNVINNNSANQVIETISEPQSTDPNFLKSATETIQNKPTFMEALPENNFLEVQPETTPTELTSAKALAKTQFSDLVLIEPVREAESIRVDVTQINLRTARKIASTITKSAPNLAVKQKINGKSTPLSWLQLQIKNRLEITPKVVIPIIQQIAPHTITNTISTNIKNIEKQNKIA